MRLYIFLFCLLAFGCSKAQNKVGNTPVQNVLIDADAMAKALSEYDFETYEKYSYPPSVENAGGKKKFIKDLKLNAKEYEKKGDKIHGITISDPSEIIKCNNELRCVLRQNTTMSISAGEPFSFSSNLIAISADSGKSWTFVNVGEDNMDKVKKDYPGICDLPLKK